MTGLKTSSNRPCVGKQSHHRLFRKQCRGLPLFLLHVSYAAWCTAFSADFVHGGAGNLLQAFRSHWQSQVLPIPPSAQTASDELQPVLIMAVRDNKDRRHLPVEHQLKAEGRLPNAVQLQEAIEVCSHPCCMPAMLL